jgi:hypothetical protein
MRNVNTVFVGKPEEKRQLGGDLDVEKGYY